jgi:Ca2+-dependent lipid-binding protein
MEDGQKEYLVQVTIIEARNLVGKSDDGLSNPFIKIKCGYLDPQATEIVYGTLTPVWNQAFSFTGLLLNKVELQKAELSFEVWSKNNFLGNSLIGTYAVGLFTLYRNANHEFYNVWLTLTCPEFPNDAQGYLLVNCFIIGPNDKPPVHSLNDKVNQDVGEEDEELNLDNMNIDQLKEYQEKKQGIIILGKPSIARKTFQLSVYVFKAEHLIEMEKAIFGAGRTDRYLVS